MIASNLKKFPTKGMTLISLVSIHPVKKWDEYLQKRGTNTVKTITVYSMQNAQPQSYCM